MIWKLTIFCLATCCVAITSPLSAQTTTEFIFDHYGPAQGLHSSEVFDVIQSSNRYLWLATDAGLVKYDGHTFRYFLHDPEDTTTISHDYVTRLTEDNHRRIWIMAGDRIDVLYPDSDNIAHVRFQERAMSHTQIKPNAFAYDSVNDVLWISSETGLYSNTGTPLQLKKVAIKGLNDYQCTGYLTVDTQGHLLLSNSYGIFRISPSGEILTALKHPDNNSSAPDKHDFLSHYQDTTGIIWSGNWTKGLTAFSPGTTQAESFLYSTHGQNAIYAIEETDHHLNTLFLGTIHGLKTFDKAEHIFTDYSANDLPADRGILGAVFAVKQIGNAIWMGTSKGLYCLDFNKHLFRKMNIEGLRSDVHHISDIQFERHSNRDSIIWFEIPYLGAFRYDLSKHQLTDLPPSLKSFGGSSAGVHTLFIDSKQHLWISSQQFGITAYNLHTHQFRIRSTTLPGNPVILGFAEGKDGRIWCTGTMGVWNIHHDSTRISEVKLVHEFIDEKEKSLFTGSPHVDRTGRLWFVSAWSDKANDAVMCYDPELKTVIYFDRDNSNTIRQLGHFGGLYISERNAIVISGEKGIVTADIQLQAPEQLANFKFVRTGQYSYDVAEDHLDRLWISAKQGILMIHPVTQHIVNFGHFNTNIGGTPAPSLTFSSHSNQLYVGQMDHLSVLDLNKNLLPACPAPTLSALTIKDKDMRRLPLNGESLSLNHRQNALLFSFTNFSYTNPELNTYAYRLHPDEPWAPATGNAIHLNSLGYGEYHLQVKTANAFGISGTDLYSLKIHITPPFVRTWWFSLLIIAGISSAIYALYRYRLTHLEKLNQMRLSIARDLHDDMGGNLSQVKILSEIEASKAGHNPVFAKINTKLGVIMDNMSEIVWSINPQKDHLSEIVLHIQEYAVETLEPLNINLHFNIDPIPDSIRFNIEARRHFYLIFKEAINNIAKYAQARNVTFALHLSSGKMQASIADDGIGFEPEVISRGNGLKNMRSRAKLLGGDIDIQTSNIGTTIMLTKNLSRIVFAKIA